MTHQCELPAWPDESLFVCPECSVTYIASIFRDDEYDLKWWGWAPSSVEGTRTG